MRAGDACLVQGALDGVAGVRCLGWMGTCGGTYLIEHRFGIEVITILHHGYEHILYGMAALAEQGGILGQGSKLYRTFGGDTVLAKLLNQMVDEIILPIDKQRGERWVIIVPAPAFAKQLGLLKIGNSHYPTFQCVDA